MSCVSINNDGRGECWIPRNSAFAGKLSVNLQQPNDWPNKRSPINRTRTHSRIIISIYCTTSRKSAFEWTIAIKIHWIRVSAYHPCWTIPIKIHASRNIPRNLGPPGNIHQRDSLFRLIWTPCDFSGTFRNEHIFTQIINVSRQKCLIRDDSADVDWSGGTWMIFTGSLVR